jgi:TRAP transporter 4TM/12TM fusion protein
MKNIGYSSTFSAAVEAVASTGGQITPPILGAAAFIIAQLVGVPYMRVVTASLIPALLYYSAVFYMIDLQARKRELSGMPKETLPIVRDVVKKTGHLILPVFVLIYVLVIMRASPIKAAIWAIYSTFLVTFLRKETRMSFKSLLQGLIKGPESAVGMISACATAGIVIGVLNLTGAGLKFAGAIIDISGGVLPVALVLTMGASLILGMGLPTTAAYLICAAVIAPALVKMGVAPLTAHMFVFYFACVSAITPPVALAAFAGAGIARAQPIPVALMAMKLGIIAFIVPYFFVYGPSLLWEGAFLRILITLTTSLIGIYALGAGLQGYFNNSRIFTIERIILISCSFMLIKPGIKTDSIGLLVLLGIFFLNKWKSKKTKGK